MSKGMVLEEVVRPDTGEIVEGVLIENPSEYTIIKKSNIGKMKKYQASKRDLEEFKDIAGGFTFMLADTLKELHKDERYTDIEKARIVFLGTFCSYSSSGNYLFTNNNKQILKSDLQELLEITNRQEFYKFYNKVADAGILIEEVISRTEIRLKWASKYHFKGNPSKQNVSSTDIVKAYDRQVQELYLAKNEKGKNINTPKNLYILFMMLPFINSESGVLCNNPHHPIEDSSEPIEVSELAEMFGYPRASVLRTKLLNCKLFGTNVFFIGEGIQNRKKYTRIYVNPFVASRTGKKPNASLLVMFPDTKKAIAEKLAANRRINEYNARKRKEKKEYK